jgi:hypothetical protein
MAFTGDGANKSKDDAAKRAFDAAKIILICVLFFLFLCDILFDSRMAKESRPRRCMVMERDGLRSPWSTTKPVLVSLLFFPFFFISQPPVRLSRYGPDSRSMQSVVGCTMDVDGLIKGSVDISQAVVR